MKKYFSIYKFIIILFSSIFIVSCVQDDEYKDPTLENYQCQDLIANVSLADAKVNYTLNTTIDSDDIIEGYVSSSDETGNIYKTIYIQDAPENPTQGFVLSVDQVSTYTKFPQGSKVYIKLKGLAIGTYGNLKQVGKMNPDGFGRIPEIDISQHIFRSCADRVNIVPKVMTLQQMTSTNDQYLGCLIQVNDAEFPERLLCTTYAPNGTSVDKVITDPTSTSTSKVVRNSGYASFANQLLPSGKGTFVGIYSKFNSTYQMYINRVSDLQMNTFPRNDGITADPCVLDETNLTSKTVAEVKQLYSGSMSQISGDFLLTGQVTANDETGNLYKYIYIEDATGGIRININKTNLFQDSRFRVGKQVKIKLKNLYVGANGGEIQLGEPFNGNIGQIAEVNVYKYFFDSNMPVTAVIPTERTINQLTTADVGKWIKIKDLQFIDSDLGKFYAEGTFTTNRTLEDCNGNTIILRTSGYAEFGEITDANGNPIFLNSNNTEVDGGKGDVYAILSIFNGTYQLWITNLLGADLDQPRCDGSIYIPMTTIYHEEFASLSNWTAINVTGAQVWNTTTFGNPAPSAIMNGFSGGAQNNEDWLVSNEIPLSGYTNYSVSFDTDGRYSGPALETFVTANYTGDPTTTSWTSLSAAYDTDLGTFNTWTNSGSINLSTFAGQNVRIAFKYVSNPSAGATTWELDNVKIKAN